MVHEEKFSAVLSDLARVLATDVPIQGILDHLVESIVDVLPITSAGVTLVSRGRAPRYIAASDGDALRFVRLQADIAEGPCVLAYETVEAAAVPDLHVRCGSSPTSRTSASASPSTTSGPATRR